METETQNSLSNLIQKETNFLVKYASLLSIIIVCVTIITLYFIEIPTYISMKLVIYKKDNFNYMKLKLDKRLNKSPKKGDTINLHFENGTPISFKVDSITVQNKIDELNLCPLNYKTGKSGQDLNKENIFIVKMLKGNIKLLYIKDLVK